MAGKINNNQTDTSTTPLAEVMAVSGRAVVTPATGGTARVLAVGDKVFLNDRVDTTEARAVILQGVDGSVVSLGEEQQLTFDQALLDQLDRIASTLSEQPDEVDFDQLAEALEAGKSLDDILPAPAAGGDSATGDDSSAIGTGVRVLLTGQRVTPESGFETRGLARADEQVLEEDGIPIPEVSIDDVTVDEAAGSVTFTVTLDKQGVIDLTVDYELVDGSATAGGDYTAQTGTLVFTPGQLTQTITVAIADDNLYEGAEQFTVVLSNVDNGEIIDGEGIATILDDGSLVDDDRPQLSVSSPTLDEGEFAIFEVGLSNPSVEDVTVDLSLADGSARVIDGDYTQQLEVSRDGGQSWQPLDGSLTIPALTTSVLVRTPTEQDPIDEPDETFSLTADWVSGTISGPTSVTGTATIIDDDPTPTINVDSLLVDEAAGSVTFTVSLTNPSASEIRVDYNSADQTAIESQDYAAVAGTLVFAPLELVKTVTVGITDDQLFEGPESFALLLSNPVNGLLGTDGLATIVDDGTLVDDDRPLVSVSDATAEEGEDLVFSVSLSNPSVEVIALDLTILADTASDKDVELDQLEYSIDGGVSWSPAAGANMPAGQTEMLVRLPTVDDNIYEKSEALSLNVEVTSGTVKNTGPVSAQGTILDNDPEPTISINDVSVNESAGVATFTVSLTNPSYQAIEVDYATGNGSAVAGSDYSSRSGRLTFEPGETVKTVSVPVLSDNIYEGTENFTVNLTNPLNATIADAQGIGTIIDTDKPTLGIVAPADNNEGATFNFAVTLSGAKGTDTAVTLSLGGAVDAADYSSYEYFDGSNWVAVPVDGGITIAAGETSVPVRVVTVDDSNFENSELLSLTAVTGDTDVSNANSPVTGSANVLDNDGTGVTIFASDPNGHETGPDHGQFTVDLGAINNSGAPITVNYTVSGSATAGGDYSSLSGSVDIAAGQQFATIDVTVLDDLLQESAETVVVSLVDTNTAGVSASGSATVTIGDNESANVTIVADGHATASSFSSSQVERLPAWC